MNTSNKHRHENTNSKMFPSAVTNNDLKRYGNDPVIVKKVEKGRKLLEKVKLT